MNNILCLGADLEAISKTCASCFSGVSKLEKSDEIVIVFECLATPVKHNELEKIEARGRRPCTFNSFHVFGNLGETLSLVFEIKYQFEPEKPIVCCLADLLRTEREMLTEFLCLFFLSLQPCFHQNSLPRTRRILGSS